jgi:hypothetical protein
MSFLRVLGLSKSLGEIKKFNCGLHDPGKRKLMSTDSQLRLFLPYREAGFYDLTVID